MEFLKLMYKENRMAATNGHFPSLFPFGKNKWRIICLDGVSRWREAGMVVVSCLNVKNSELD